MVLLLRENGTPIAVEAASSEEASDVAVSLLQEALLAPPAGGERRPDTIRVSDRDLGRELRSVMPGKIRIEVAPTPEVHALVDKIVDDLHPEMSGDGEELSYFEGGTIPADAIADMFEAVRQFHRAAPWETMEDQDLVRLDIPALDIAGACVSIIGKMRNSFGFIVFPSFGDFLGFQDAAMEVSDGEQDFDGMGPEFVSLNFERASDLPEQLRREAASHGWPVDQVNAYPMILAFEDFGATRAVTHKDVKTVTAFAEAMTDFYAKHRDRILDGRETQVSEEFVVRGGLTVKLAYPNLPLNLGEMIESGLDDPGYSYVSRSEPCPCGSGSPYEECCLAKDKDSGDDERRRQYLHDLDAAMTSFMIGFGRERYGSSLDAFEDDILFDYPTTEGRDPLEGILRSSWTVHHCHIDGKTIAQRFVEVLGQTMTDLQRKWIEAQSAAWLSVWEVTAVEAGKELRMRDLLTGEVRRVQEKLISENAAIHDVILGRIVDFDRYSLFCGVHMIPLTPLLGADVVKEAKRKLRRKRNAPVDRIRDEKFGRFLIEAWENACEEISEYRESLRPRNFDHDPIIITVDRFRIKPAATGEVEAILSSLEDTRESERADAKEFQFVEAGIHPLAGDAETVIGQAVISGNMLRIETNSQARADRLRKRIDDACGDLVRHLIREHADPLSKGLDHGDIDSLEPSALPPEAIEAAQQHFDQLLKNWLNDPIPALGGKTPRQAVKSAAGRAEVETLLKDYENKNARMKGFVTMDVGKLRRELGLT